MCLLCALHVLYLIYTIYGRFWKMNEFDKRFEKLRCNLTIPAEVVEEVDKLAKTYGATRSVMVTFMLKTYLDQQKVVELAKLVPEKE